MDQLAACFPRQVMAGLTNHRECNEKKGPHWSFRQPFRKRLMMKMKLSVLGLFLFAQKMTG